MKKNILTLFLFFISSLLFISLILPKVNNADIAFAQNMSEHHNQAVEMSFVVLANSENSDLKGLAYDIINTQSTQRGMMMAWLQDWDKSLNSDLDHTQMKAMGMASKVEMERLYELGANELDVLFVELMIQHHMGGIEMAETYTQVGKYELLVDLAESMVAGQKGEVKYLNSLDEAI
jgi:uncharacterized protein (DUF305 family)